MNIGNAILLITAIIFLIKNNNTDINHGIIIDAIYDYSISSIRNGDFEQDSKQMYDSMEHYNRTLFRIWDWGYTRIVPPDVFDKISPFIKEAQ